MPDNMPSLKHKDVTRKLVVMHLAFYVFSTC